MFDKLSDQIINLRSKMETCIGLPEVPAPRSSACANRVNSGLMLARSDGVDSFPAMTACAIAWLRDVGGIASVSSVAGAVVVAVLVGTVSTDGSEGDGAAKGRRDSRVRTAVSMDCCKPASRNAVTYNSKA